MNEIRKKYKPKMPIKLIDNPPNKELEIKNVVDNESSFDVEGIKARQKKVVDEARINQEKLKLQKLKNTRDLKISIIIGLLVFIICLIFVPIFPVKNTTVSEQKYLKLTDLDIPNPLNNFFSPYQFIRYQYQVANSNEYIKSSRVKYNLPTMTLDITIEEYIPLAKDTENNVYFYENNQVIKQTDLDVYAPVVTGFDKEGLEKLLKDLKELDYDTLSQIDTITSAATEEFPELLQLGMNGNQIVYINSSQMKEKLPYYPQIKKIIDEKANGEPGIIHLELGDYYEPKK